MLAWTDVRTIIRVQNIRPLYQYLDNKIKENAFRYSQANFKIKLFYSFSFHSQKITFGQSIWSVPFRYLSGIFEII